jgi:hypothetical protein
MSHAQRQASTPAPGAPRRWLHFGLAAGLLLLAGAGWNGIMAALHWTMAKEPVPWPEGVEVEDHRLINFPERLGPYLLVQDGELEVERDGKPDGLFIFRDEDLETLGTLAHELNWYYSALYRETGAPPGKAKQYVRVEITYYTGLLDAVPHIPDVCVGVAGATVVAKESGPITITVPAVPAPWNAFDVHRTTYVRQDRKTAQYYFFSMNGEPTARWEMVRGRLTLPWVRYCYFAKVQLGAFKTGYRRLVPETDPAECDRLCADFLKYGLPHMLRFLPSAGDVAKLKGSGGSE